MLARDRSRVLIEEALTRRVIGAFYRVYDVLDYGFLEAVYRRALVIELRRRGMQVQEEYPIQVRYLDQVVGMYRAYILVEGQLILEIKATASVGDADRAQLFNYLRGTGMTIGLLLHFGPKPRVMRAIAGPTSVDTDAHLTTTDNI
jgi:GxxExxY protein